MFRMDDLALLEKRHAVAAPKTEHPQRVFTRELRDAFHASFGPDAGGLSLPESYLRYFFPLFDPAAYVRAGAGFSLRARGLFQPGEAAGVINFLCERLRARNRRNLVSRAIVILKKTAIAAFIIFHAVLLLYDLVIMLYGTSRNEYYYTFQNLGQELDTCDTPYARRAERIYRRNSRARFGEFSSTIGPPSPGNSYRVTKTAQLAVELNYTAYRSLRVEDQNGLTIVAIDRRAMASLAQTEPARHRALADLMIEKRWWEKILSGIDDLSGDRLDLFDYRKFDGDRLSADVAKKIMESPAPLAWIDRVNAVSDVVTVVFTSPTP